MSSRIARMSLLALALALCGSLAVHAADGEKPKGERGGRGGGPVKMLLAKADEYKLTDEQKTKLEALGKTLADKQAAGEKPDREATHAEIAKILTPEQLAKWDENMKAMREKRGGDKPGEKKPENK
jgi:Spy/CpxP family protein refolding chaperone